MENLLRNRSPVLSDGIGSQSQRRFLDTKPLVVSVALDQIALLSCLPDRQCEGSNFARQSQTCGPLVRESSVSRVVAEDSRSSAGGDRDTWRLRSLLAACKALQTLENGGLKTLAPVVHLRLWPLCFQ